MSWVIYNFQPGNLSVSRKASDHRGTRFDGGGYEDMGILLLRQDTVTFGFVRTGVITKIVRQWM